MSRCGCQDKTCSCTIRAGSGVAITGLDPIQIGQGDAATKLVSLARTDLIMNVTGAGTVASPYQLSGDLTGVTPADRPLRVEAYVTPGTYTWVRPVGVTILEVVCVGGGNGGGGGAGGTAAVVHAGAFGGWGGQLTRHYVVLDAGCTGATVVVGAGGAGAPGATASTTISTGGEGQASSVTWLGWSGPPVKANGSQFPEPRGVYEKFSTGGRGGRGSAWSTTSGASLRSDGLRKPISDLVTSATHTAGSGGAGGYAVSDPARPVGASTQGVNGSWPGGGGGGGGAGSPTSPGQAGGNGGGGAVWIVML